MQQLVETFYLAFKNLDAETMVSCYHNDIIFNDPAFGTLKGERAKNMWRMLCESQKGKNFIVDASEIDCNDDSGTAHWEAHYSFSKTGRKVHNIIDAEFKFKDGKIINHIDRFDLHKWAKQAIGFKGFLLGGTNFFKNKLHSQTHQLLLKFEKS
jgi:limonene-1,2-epoxide hydrolase